jgi:uncharacterized phage protein gp47/JayE
MSQQNPTTAELTSIVSNMLQAELNESVPLLPKAFTSVISKAVGAIAKLLFNYGGYNALQQFVRTASFKPTTINGRVITPLIELGVLVGVGTPGAATQAELTVAVPVTQQTGYLASGSQLVSASTGVTYVTLGVVLLNAASVAVDIRAVSDSSGTQGAGSQGNLEAGDVLSFVKPIGEISGDATVTAVLVTGADGEKEDIYRQRVLDRFQKRPQGGATADYEQWAEEVPGIINAYPYTDPVIPGKVNVYCEATVASSGDPDGIPTTAQLTAVGESINLDQSGLATRRQISALVEPLAISRVTFDVSVTGLAGVANLGQTQTDINTAVREFFLSAEPYIAGLTVGRRRERITRSALIGLIEDIVTAAGGSFTTATFSVNGVGTPLESHTLAAGTKAKLVGTGVVFS